MLGVGSVLKVKLRSGLGPAEDVRRGQCPIRLQYSYPHGTENRKKVMEKLKSKSAFLP